MSDDARVTTTLNDLDAALRGTLGIRRVDRVEDFVAAGKHTRYLREPRLTFALHFDIAPKFLILDPLLGTLGIVELIAPGLDTSEVAKQVRRCIDRATYMRHLLLRDRSRDQRRPLTVEMVLLTAEPDNGEASTLDAIGTALRTVVQDTDSLFHIGVSLLCHGGGEKRFDNRLRRAFPWLLTAARRWLMSNRARVEEADKNGSRMLRRLRLTNYRLPGVREITFSDARVHLMHGPNGSGKSSIAEALEIVTCGTVQRLSQGGAAQYDAVIKHSTSAKPATVQMGWMDDTQKQIVEEDPRLILPEGLKDPLDATIDVGSFRLDQPLMDRLIGRSPHERAKIFLDAFFPTAVSSKSKYEHAAEAHQQALARLDVVAQRLTTAKEALNELQHHKASGTKQTTEEFPVVLNRWLEQTALVDLLHRQRIVRATIAEARALGWSAFDKASETAAAALGEIDLETLERTEKEARAAVDDLLSKLASFSATDTSQGAQLPVSRPVVDTLNAICRFLFTPDDIQSFGQFGDKVAAVFNAGGARTYGSIAIGNDKWAEPILRDLDVLIAACGMLRTDDGQPPDWPGKSACTEYDVARQTHAARLEAGRELSANFIDKLRPDEGAKGEFDGALIAALNEVMALFTPARWAYSDIRLPTNVADGKVGVAMHLDGEDSGRAAELHLNTAELNLFTVALFLLCVGRVRKPLNLLIFDDPLQNMDELTSTALARGLAKIVRLWSDLDRTEELLILFHGYNDLERFGTELPAASYRLPWLSPSVAATTIKVTADGPGGDVLAVQRIDGMSPVFSQ